MAQNNLESFKKYVTSSNVFNLMDKQDTSDPNLNYNTILDVITKAKETCLPTQIVKFNKHKHKDSKWISQGIIKSIVHRDKWYVNLKKTSTTDPIFMTMKTNF